MTHGTRLQVFATSTASHLIEVIANELDIEPGKSKIKHYPDKESRVELGESVAGRDVVIVGSTQAPLDNTLELAMFVDAAKRSRAQNVFVVASYLGYTRSSKRKEDSRVAVTFPLAFAPVMQARPDLLVLLDTSHREAFAFAPVNTVHLYGSVYSIGTLKAAYAERKFKVVPFSDGGVKLARRFAELIGAEYVAEVKYLRSKQAVLFVDSILADPTDLFTAVDKAKSRGASHVQAYFSHTLLSRQDAMHIEISNLDRLFVTDSIWRDPGTFSGSTKIQIISCSMFLAEVIRRACNGESLDRDQLANWMKTKM